MVWNTLLPLLYILATAGDVTSTCVGLQRGLHELNHFLPKSCHNIALVKGAVATGVVALKPPRWVYVVGIAAGGLATAWNVHQIQQRIR